MQSEETNTSEPRQPSNFYRLAWVFYLLLASLAVLWIGKSQGAIALALFINLDAWLSDVALGLASGIGLVVLWDVSKIFIAGMRQLERELAAQIGSLDSSEAVALALISGFSEELFFRGAIQLSWGWFWAAVAFTFMHLGAGRVFQWWTLFALISAIIFGMLTVFRGNLLPAVIAHSVVNGINLRRLAKLD